MLNLKRTENIMNILRESGIRQMLITAPASIFYLMGQWIRPGERFLGLLLRDGEVPAFFVNELFPAQPDPSVKFVRFSDTDDAMLLVAAHTDKNAALGVDKILPARFLLRLMELGAAAAFRNGSYAVDTVRAQKDAEEIRLMKEASVINDMAMEQFKGLIREGITEKEAADEMIGIYKSLGASGYSFEPIVGFGAKAADPHHDCDDTVLQEGDCVLFDVGCRKDWYCSDMTRTYFYKKEPTQEQKRIYELVLSANETAESMLRPGIPVCSLDNAARDIITKGGYGPNFTHRLGHFIGTEVHEYGDVSSANTDLTAVGNIFSIEPGIYCAGKNIGVRIEDLVLITENGGEILNHQSKKLEVIG